MLRRTFLKMLGLGAVAPKSALDALQPVAQPVVFGRTVYRVPVRPIYHDLYGGSVVDIEAFIRNDMAQAMAEHFDRVFYTGGGHAIDSVPAGICSMDGDM